MKSLLTRLVFFFVPLLLVATFVECTLRHDNAFYFKEKYFEANHLEAEVLFLGSSHTNWAINPELLSVPAINLANDGGALNLDLKLLQHYLPRLPKLKVIIIELGYQSLEREQGPDYLKNNLYEIYFGIDNYANGMPLRDRVLVLSNPREYLKIFWKDIKYPKVINETGYLEKPGGKIESRFSFLNYDTARIRQTKENHLYARHNEIDPELAARYSKELEELEETCRDRGIQLIFLSPPKYYLYNEANIREKIIRRDSVAAHFASEGVPFWNFEHFMEHEVEYFSNEDHLNARGATIFTREIDKKLRELPGFSGPLGEGL